MPLTIAITDRLGERRRVLGERDAAAATPAVVGRERGAAMTVASYDVRPRHCAVWHHAQTGQWVLQDGGTDGGTRLNGVPVDGPRRAYALQPGDRVELGDGDDPPTIAVEAIEPPALEVVAPPPTVEPAARSAEFDAMPELVEVARQARARPRVNRRRRSAFPAVLGLLALAATLALGGWGLVVLKGKLDRIERRAAANQPPPATRPAEPPPPVSEPVEPPPPAPRPSPYEGLDVIGDEPFPDPAPADDPTDPAGVVGEVGGVPVTDPRRATDAWAAVAEARRSRDVGRELRAYQQYREAAGNDALGRAVGEWLDAAVDTLWWDRVAELLDREFALTDAALDLESRLRRLDEDAPAGEAGRLGEELHDVRRDLMAARYALAETMRYSEIEAPDPNDPRQLARLRERRDSAAYETWRREVLRATLETGELPWQGDVAEETPDA